jgi:hypothetical protein
MSNVLARGSRADAPAFRISYREIELVANSHWTMQLEVK